VRVFVTLCSAEIVRESEMRTAAEALVSISLCPIYSPTKVQTFSVSVVLIPGLYACLRPDIVRLRLCPAVQPSF
jgi:hypothetical protein